MFKMLNVRLILGLEVDWIAIGYAVYMYKVWELMQMISAYTGRCVVDSYTGYRCFCLELGEELYRLFRIWCAVNDPLIYYLSTSSLPLRLVSAQA